MTNLKIMESKQQLLVPLVLNGVVGDVPLGVPVRICNVQEIRSENLTILRNGYKSWDHHCSPSHTKMAASAWPGGGETAAADENKFCSLYKIKVGTDPAEWQNEWKILLGVSINQWSLHTY